MAKLGWLAIATAAFTFQCAHAGPTAAGGGGGSGNTSTAMHAGEAAKAPSDANSLKTWEGDQWKNSGGTWGWYSYDESSNLDFYGAGNPSPWNPGPPPNVPEEGYCSVCMD